MSFPNDASYKNSGVEWLGALPKEWEITRLKRMLREPVTDGPHTTPHFIEDGVPFLSVDGIQDGELRFDSCRFITAEDHADYKRKALPRRGDILMGKAASTGKIARVKVDFEFSIWSPLALIRLDHRLADPSYVEHCLKSPFCQAQIEVRCTSNTQKNISMDEIPNLVLPLPPREDQSIIAAFCETESLRVERLIAEQRLLIDLLNEKRQAVISHAVTKGLNPDAPMKPSGIEWLGDVPAHWEVMPIRFAARLESGHTPSRNHPEYWENCGVPWFTLSDVWQIREEARDIIYETEELISELGIANSAARKLPAGTVMLSRTASVGFSALMGVEMATSQDFANWVCGSQLVPLYLLQVFRSMQGEFVRLKMGSTHNTIYMPDIQSLRFALPPLEEQRSIITFVKREASRIDALRSEAQLVIELLQDRRTALISAAVTGQIDVRDIVAAAPIVAARPMEVA